MSDRPRPKFTLKSLQKAEPPAAASVRVTEKSDLEIRLRSFQNVDISVKDKLIGQTITATFPSDHPPSYRIIGELGKGGIGCVYRAIEEGPKGKTVAIKILSETHCDNAEIRERFVREWEIMRGLDHPNAAKVFSTGKIGKRLFIAMEFLEGHDLHQEIQRNGLLSPGAIRRMMIQACSALSVAHERGVVHRDIKPGNIFLTSDARGNSVVKVLDFGLALSYNKMDDRTRLTVTGTTFGTPAYMAPEQIMGAKKVDRRSDVYSLGVTMYVTLCGQLPYPGENLIDKINSMNPNAKPKPPSEVAPQNGISPEMDRIVMKAIDFWPHMRFSTMNELRDALIRCEENEMIKVQSVAGGRHSQMVDDSDPPTQVIITQRPSAVQRDSRQIADQTIPEISIPLEELMEEPSKHALHENRTGVIGVLAISVITALSAAWIAWHLLDPEKRPLPRQNDHVSVDGGEKKP